MKTEIEQAREISLDMALGLASSRFSAVKLSIGENEVYLNERMIKILSDNFPYFISDLIQREEEHERKANIRYLEELREISNNKFN